MLGKGIEQLQAFAVFAVLGAALTAVYLFGWGLFRGKLAGIVFDAIFSAVALWLVFITNLNVNNGEFRLFVFLGLALGAIICVVTCKTLLDKVSSSLYNLFTASLEDKNDGTHILQQKDVDTVRSGDVSVADTGVYAVDNVDANGVDETTRRSNSSSNRRSHKARRNVRRVPRAPRNRRVRNRMGRKNGQA